MFYGEDGVLDLQKAESPKRFNKYLRKMKRDIGIVVQPLVTLEERSRSKYYSAIIHLKLEK